MRFRPNFIPALGILLLAPALAAQARPAPAAGAISPIPAETPRGSVVARHRILALAWMEITIPGSLDRPAAPPSPVGVARPVIFTLAWQETGAAVLSSDRVALAPAPACQTTVLVPVPCE